MTEILGLDVFFFIFILDHVIFSWSSIKWPQTHRTDVDITVILFIYAPNDVSRQPDHNRSPPTMHLSGLTITSIALGKNKREMVHYAIMPVSPQKKPDVVKQSCVREKTKLIYEIGENDTEISSLHFSSLDLVPDYTAMFKKAVELSDANILNNSIDAADDLPISTLPHLKDHLPIPTLSRKKKKEKRKDLFFYIKKINWTKLINITRILLFRN